MTHSVFKGGQNQFENKRFDLLILTRNTLRIYFDRGIKCMQICLKKKSLLNGIK